MSIRKRNIELTSLEEWARLAGPKPWQSKTAKFWDRLTSPAHPYSRIPEFSISVRFRAILEAVCPRAIDGIAVAPVSSPSVEVLPSSD